MKTVGAYEAKTRFGELLREVENGETIIVTRHGLPVARLSPMERKADDVVAAMEEIHRFRRQHRPTWGESRYANSLKKVVSDPISPRCFVCAVMVFDDEFSSYSASIAEIMSRSQALVPIV